MIEIKEGMKVSKSCIKFVEFQINPAESSYPYRVQITIGWPDGSGCVVDRDFDFEDESRAFYRLF